MAEAGTPRVRMLPNRTPSATTVDEDLNNVASRLERVTDTLERRLAELRASREARRAEGDPDA